MHTSPALALVLSIIAASAAAAPLKVSISAEPREEISTATFMERYRTLAGMSARRPAPTSR